MCPGHCSSWLIFPPKDWGRLKFCDVEWQKNDQFWLVPFLFHDLLRCFILPNISILAAEFAAQVKSRFAAIQVSVLKLSITRIACVCSEILAPSLTTACKLSKANAFVEDTTQFTAPHCAHPYISNFVFMRYSDCLPLHVALFCQWSVRDIDSFPCK
jgi:hypothetical protein